MSVPGPTTSARLEASGHCVIRVLPVPSGPLAPNASAVHAAFARFGVGGEVFSAELPLVAFDVPADADFSEIQQVLTDGKSHGWRHFEVGCGTGRWWNSAGPELSRGLPNLRRRIGLR
ncbi:MULTISPECIES: DUF4265 domain-containing protein [unclassified Actinoplanes]|uniref:DUF4265 domain-containing protein n=1 Tax=unclassified Actinoplanes TaxID=2626549 RepID=UPI0009B126FD|nr:MULTISPECIES: DUF4265 domain-containing protein [unclassified Actinoplanes]